MTKLEAIARDLEEALAKATSNEERRRLILVALTEAARAGYRAPRK